MRGVPPRKVGPETIPREGDDRVPVGELLRCPVEIHVVSLYDRAVPEEIDATVRR